MARSRLPSPFFHYLDGGADDEWSLRNNEAAFSRYSLLPALARDKGEIDLSVTVLGAPSSMPVMLSPTGMTRLFHREREIGVAKAANRAGLFYSLSTFGSTTIEDVAAANPGPKVFQVYITRDRNITRDLVERTRAAGFTALAVTVDTPTPGNRERDLHTGMTMPPRLSLASLFSFARSFGWTLDYLRDQNLSIANIDPSGAEFEAGGMSPVQYANHQIDPTISWADIEWLKGEWGGPMIVKGVLGVEEAKRAASAGANAIMISNHGGRQLDQCPAPIESLPAIRDAVGGDLELIVDGGVRRGTDIIKARALGADVCAIARPYLYALAAGGGKGVDRLLALLRAELERDLILMGKNKFEQVSAADVVMSPA